MDYIVIRWRMLVWAAKAITVYTSAEQHTIFIIQICTVVVAPKYNTYSSAKNCPFIVMYLKYNRGMFYAHDATYII